VGGGIATLDDMSRVLQAGAEKISVNTLAVRNPALIAEGARAFGSQCIVVGMDPKAVAPSDTCPSGYEVTVRGFREYTGLDALAWARRVVELGAGEIVVNSVDADGTRAGYALALTRRIAETVSVPVVASGGAGKPEHLVEVFRDGRADAAIIAGMIHTGAYSIPQIKQHLAAAGVPVRQHW
ncbi:MAG: imidazole glycerol phosphate synthase cyclase subunit, partial [Lentisphaerae bacterium]|nr:imidazole glycerol phosphate synthase cyclase subunit [Lentisphaerota bacterium]